MSARCYVCGSPADAGPAADPRNPVCQRHLAARDHTISMRTNDMVCSCGWSSGLSYRQHAERARACREHWEDISGEQK